MGLGRLYNPKDYDEPIPKPKRVKVLLAKDLCQRCHTYSWSCFDAKSNLFICGTCLSELRCSKCRK